MVLRRKPAASDLVEIVETTKAYEGYFELDRHRLRHRRFAGDWTPVLSREVFERGHAVCLLPYDPKRDEVVLIEQFRIGAYGAGQDPWLMEVVAGIIEPGESPAEVARREAMEEADLTIGRLVDIGEILASPGGTSETFRLYCGEARTAGAGGLHGLHDEGEDIKVHVMTRLEASDKLTSGAIVSAPAVIALQWLALNHARLMDEWGV